MPKPTAPTTYSELTAAAANLNAKVTSHIVGDQAQITITDTAGATLSTSAPDLDTAAAQLGKHLDALAS